MTTQPVISWLNWATEELPPKSLKTLADNFLAGIENGLKQAGLSLAPCPPTPRRAVWR
jgi:glycyl-tRNA synthetase beta chain